MASDERGFFEIFLAALAFILLWLRRAIVLEKSIASLIKAWCFFHDLMPKKRGFTMEIKDTLELIDLGIAIGSGVVASLKDDNKFTVTDVMNFMPALMTLPAAIDGVQNIPSELKDVNDTELNQIRDHILEKIPNVGDKWLVVGKECFSIGVSIYKIVSTIKASM